MKEKKVYVFFNCDEEKNKETMNVFYNDTAFGETKKARKELAAKIEEELAAGRIQIAESDRPKVEDAILNGDPAEASNLITFGAIVPFTLI